MLSFFKRLYFPSQLLSSTDLDLMCIDGEVLEQDPRGVKVVLLTSGDILKIFRTRNKFSGTRLYSHARRFCRNAARLHELAVPTIEVKALYHLEENGQTAVLYTPLVGESIRHLVQLDLGRMQETAGTFGAFLSDLHAKGVHFHSLHTGNILLLPNNQFGLIDVSDMSIYAWSLSCYTRLRSFKRLCKYDEDISALGNEYWQKMLESYFSRSQLRAACKQCLIQFKPF